MRVIQNHFHFETTLSFMVIWDHFHFHSNLKPLSLWGWSGTWWESQGWHPAHIPPRGEGQFAPAPFLSLLSLFFIICINPFFIIFIPYYLHHSFLYYIFSFNYLHHSFSYYLFSLLSAPILSLLSLFFILYYLHHSFLYYKSLFHSSMLLTLWMENQLPQFGGNLELNLLLSPECTYVYVWLDVHLNGHTKSRGQCLASPQVIFFLDLNIVTSRQGCFMWAVTGHWIFTEDRH